MIQSPIKPTVFEYILLSAGFTVEGVQRALYKARDEGYLILTNEYMIANGSMTVDEFIEEQFHLVGDRVKLTRLWDERKETAEAVIQITRRMV